MARNRGWSQIKKAFRFALQSESKGWDETRLREHIDFIESRRNFIRAGAAAAATMAVAPISAYARRRSSQPVQSTSKMDPVLILGAGAAGLAAAYTLYNKGIPFKIVEANSRVGGRILTRSNYNSKGQFIEYGAELVDSDHSTLIGLAKALGLQMQSIASPSDLNPELYYVGGQYYKWTDLVAQIKPLLKAVANAQNNGADWLDYNQYAKNAAASRYDRMSTAQFLDSLSGTVASWVLQVIRIEYTAEFGVDLSQQSSLNFIWDIDTSVSSFKAGAENIENLRVAGGSSQIPAKLYSAITGNGSNPGVVMLGAQVQAIKKSGSNLVVTVSQNGVVSDLTYSQVICTLPYSTLRNVAGLASLGLSAPKLLCINSLGYGTNSKVLLEFASKPWLKAGTAPASAGTIYTDLLSQSFWEASRAQPGTNGILVNYLSGKAGAAAGNSTATSQALPDLVKIYPSLANNLVSTTMMNWSQVPTALGSYACMLTGQFGQFNGVQGTAELNGQLLFAGEHTSEEYQGYMEGAYQTGIAAAKKIISSRGISVAA